MRRGGRLTLAAATIVELEPLGRRDPPPSTPFVANRPFLYFLREKRTGAVLFAGGLADAAVAQG